MSHNKYLIPSRDGEKDETTKGTWRNKKIKVDLEHVSLTFISKKGFEIQVLVTYTQQPASKNKDVWQKRV